jgi:hypothetical protein
LEDSRLKASTGKKLREDPISANKNWTWWHVCGLNYAGSMKWDFGPGCPGLKAPPPKKKKN